MNNVVEFLTSKEVVVVYVLAAIACVLALLIYFIDKNLQKRKQKNNTKELNKLVEQVADKLEEQKIVQPTQTIKEEVVTPVVTTTEPTVVAPPVPVVETIQPSIETVVEVVSVPTPPQAEMAEVKPEQNVVVLEEVVEPIAVEQPTIETPEVIVNEIEKVETLEETPVENLILDEMSQGIEEPEVEPEKQVVTEIIEEDKKVEEIIKYGDNEPDRTTAQAELEKLTAELKKADQTANIDLTDFEMTQEENAIISLDELMAKGNTLYEENEETQYKDEGNEPISIQDLEERMKTIRQETKALTMETTPEPIEVLDDVEPIVTEIETIQPEPNPVQVESRVHLDDFHSIGKPIENNVPVYQKPHTFKSSPIISPIYGIKDKTDIELENTSNYEKLDEEIRKTNEFLITLKELQKKLD